MMKRYFLMMVVALTTALNVQAGDYDYLIVQKSDGTKQSFTALGLTLTFENGNLVATQDGTTTTLTLTDLSKMFFDSEPAGVREVSADDTEDVIVYTPSGLTLGHYHSLNDARYRLPRGLYIVKTGNKTIKVSVK